MNDSVTTVRLRDLVLHFDVQNGTLLIVAKPAAPGRPAPQYRPAAVAFEDLEALILARYLSTKEPPS